VTPTHSTSLPRDICPNLAALDLPEEYDEAIKQITKHVQEVNRKKKEQEELQEKQIAEEKRKKSLRINFDEAYVDLIKGGGFVSLGRTEGLGEYLYKKYDRLEFDWFDEDKFRQRLYDDASSKAYEDMPPRPSDSYGENQDDVNEDIYFYGDDYLEDIGFFESEEGEKYINADYADVVEFVKNNQEYRDGFIEWRQSKIRREEGDWEPDNDSILEEANKIGPSILEKMALITV
jgi:hypothetical protein